MSDVITIGNPRSSGYERADYDWYVEPIRATEELLKAEGFRAGVWDPACGGGNILKACRDIGIQAFGTDIVQRGSAGYVIDFLQCSVTTMCNIITNPPFDRATEFALHGLSLIPEYGKVAILQRTSWLEGEKRYQSLFRHGWLKKVWQFRRRISMPPGGRDIPAKNGSVAYAWFVFSKSHNGPCELGWLP